MTNYIISAIRGGGRIYLLTDKKGNTFIIREKDLVAGKIRVIARKLY